MVLGETARVVDPGGRERHFALNSKGDDPKSYQAFLDKLKEPQEQKKEDPSAQKKEEAPAQKK